MSTRPIQLPLRQITCQNMTMAQFADQLQNLAGPYIQYPVLNATGLEGAWDFAFSFSPIPANLVAGRVAPIPSHSLEKPIPERWTRSAVTQFSTL